MTTQQLPVRYDRVCPIGVPVLDRYLRQPKERLLEPLATHVSLSPTGITALSFTAGLLCAGVTVFGLYGLGLALWLLNRALDGLDGTLARRTGQQTDLGGYLDMLSDLAIYALVPLALTVSRPEAPFLALGFLLSSFYLNLGSWLYLSALLEKRGFAKKELTSITMPPGLIEGTETILFYSLFFLLPHALTPLFSLMAFLVFVTALQRPLWAAKALR